MKQEKNYEAETQKLFEAIEEEIGYKLNFEIKYAEDDWSDVTLGIKESPGWRYGLWWNYTGNNTGAFFTQYEETIDKFKPSRSVFCKLVHPEDIDVSAQSIAEMINFIIKEPHLAFCRDYYDWDYNTEFHSREEAEQKFNEWKMKHDNDLRITAECDEAVMNFVNAKILPMLEGSRVVDMGDFVSPRYQVIAPWAKNQEAEGPGLYGWFEEGDPLKDEFKAIVDECRKKARENECYWWPPIHDSVSLYEEEDKDISVQFEKINADDER